MPSIEEAKSRMDSAVEALQREFTSVRTGKAAPALLDSVKVEAYGTQMPLNQVATVSAPEARLLVIQPWDQSQLGSIEKSIREADLGLNPSNDGKIIRVPIPALTQERRKEYVRLLHKMAEEGRISVRHARKEANDEIKTRQKEGELSEDEARRETEEVQRLTDSYIEKIDELTKHKEAEIMEV